VLTSRRFCLGGGRQGGLAVAVLDRPAGRPVGQLAIRLAIPQPSGRVPGSRGRSTWRRGQSPQGPRGSDQNGKVKKQWDAESTGKGTGAGRQAVVYMLSEQPEDTQTNIYIYQYTGTGATPPARARRPRITHHRPQRPSNTPVEPSPASQHAEEPAKTAGRRGRQLAMRPLPMGGPPISAEKLARVGGPLCMGNRPGARTTPYKTSPPRIDFGPANVCPDSRPPSDVGGTM